MKINLMVAKTRNVLILSMLVILLISLFSQECASQDIRLRTITQFVEGTDKVREISLLVHFTEDERVIIYNYEGENLVYDVVSNSGTIIREDGGFSIVLGIIDKRGDFNTMVVNYGVSEGKENLFWIEKNKKSILNFTFKELN